MNPKIFFLIVCLLLGMVLPATGQLVRPTIHEFSLSKVGKEDAMETEAQAQVLLGLIRDIAFVDKEQKVVMVLNTPAKLYYVDRVAQRFDSQKFAMEMNLRHPDGTKMANVSPRRYLLRTVREQSWTGSERPERKIFAREVGIETYLAQDGKTHRAAVLQEVTAETLGYRTMLRSDLDAVTRAGFVFQVTEFMPQPQGKPPLRRVWQVKW